jgi:hypothetical protein
MAVSPTRGSENGSTLVLAEGKHITCQAKSKKKIHVFRFIET